MVKRQEVMKEKKNGSQGIKKLKMHNKFGDTVMATKAYGNRL